MRETPPSRRRVGARAVARVLHGNDSYDLLGQVEQAVVCAVWAQRIEALRGDLNYEAEFVAAGGSYSEADETGDVVLHPVRG